MTHFELKSSYFTDELVNILILILSYEVSYKFLKSKISNEFSLTKERNVFLFFFLGRNFVSKM